MLHIADFHGYRCWFQVSHTTRVLVQLSMYKTNTQKTWGTSKMVSIIISIMMQVAHDRVPTCEQVTAYSGDICRYELLALQTCFSGVTSPALDIPSSIDQETGESDAVRLVNSLSSFNSSQQCQEAIMPFLCISIFNLCDSSNTLHTITREDCLYIRDDVCTSEWSMTVKFLGADVLPVCEDLPDNNVECIGIQIRHCQ